MRRALVFALFMVPAIMWAGLQAWTQDILTRAELLDTPLSQASRLLLFVSHWVNRELLPATLVLLVISPACVAAIAWAAGTLREAEATKAAKTLVMWWSVSLASLALVVVVVKLVGTSCLSYLESLMWAAFVSYSISIGSAFALQRQRVAAGYSKTKAGWWLALGAWLFWSACLPAFVFPIGVWVLWRRDLRRARKVAVRENAC